MASSLQHRSYNNAGADLPLSELQPDPPASPVEVLLPALSEEVARSAFIRFAAERRCTSTKPAERCIIRKMEDFHTFRYRLETFTETRAHKEIINFYFGGEIDDDNAGQPAPEPWEVPVDAPPFFQEMTETIRIPDTESLERCSWCSGSGETTCNSCDGRRKLTCIGCGGIGYVSYGSRQPCNVCGGLRKTNCVRCHSSGKINCSHCSSQGEVVISLGVEVIWKNIVAEHVVEQSSGLNMSVLGQASGRQLFTESGFTVGPVSTFPVPGVVQASEQLLAKHREGLLPSSRILQQRQTIEQLPITKVTYEWRGKTHLFFIYGTELKVSADEYPAACCCYCC